MNNGRWLIITYLLIYYIFPMIGNSIFADKIFTIYEITPLNYYITSIFASIIILFFLINLTPEIRILPNYYRYYLQSILIRMGTIYHRIRIYLSLISIPLGAIYIYFGYNSYRYSNDGISGDGTLFNITIIIMNLLIIYDMFYQIYSGQKDIMLLNYFSKRRIANILFSLSLMLTANGTANMLIALFVLLFSLFPDKFNKFLFVEKKQSNFMKLKKNFEILAISFCVCIFAWIAGETIKAASANRTGNLLESANFLIKNIDESPELIENFGYYLISAMSSHYYSMNYVLETISDESQSQGASVLVHPLQAFVYRLDIFLGGILKIDRPEFGSLSRLNYVLLSRELEISERQGTSPGLIASFFYIFPTAIAIFICAYYMSWVARVINNLLINVRDQSLSIFGILLLLQFMLIFFQSPFDLFAVFDNGFLMACILVLISYSQKLNNNDGIKSKRSDGMN